MDYTQKLLALKRSSVPLILTHAFIETMDYNEDMTHFPFQKYFVSPYNQYTPMVHPRAVGRVTYMQPTFNYPARAFPQVCFQDAANNDRYRCYGGQGCSSSYRPNLENK